MSISMEALLLAHDHLEHVMAAVQKPEKYILPIGGPEEELMLNVFLELMRREYDARSLASHYLIPKPGGNSSDV